MRCLNQLLIFGFMWAGSWLTGNATPINYVMQDIDEPMIIQPQPAVATTSVDAMAGDQFSAQVVEQLLVQWPVDALNLQLASMQQELVQLHQQLTMLSASPSQINPVATSSARPLGIFGSLALVHPIGASMLFLILILGLAGRLLAHRWRVIQTNGLTLDDDLLQTGSHDKIASQLDMAMSYFSLEQYEQALALIHQVLDQGDDQQRAEARLLQQQIQQAVG